jgi:Ras family protein T1
VLEAEVRAANVIALVYVADDESGFERLGSYWLPYIRSLGVNVPVVLVGNKIDIRGGDMSNAELEDRILPLMNDFKEVETCVECSARALVNIAEVFYFSQKAVLHPTAPLYDSREHTLKLACEAALTRIFRICDLNRDGLLDDVELNEFQTICFAAPLQKAELEGVKGVIKAQCPEGLSEASPHQDTDDAFQEYTSPIVGVNLDGFLFLHRLFIQRGRLETTWTVLRRFGYDDDLSLREDYLRPPAAALNVDEAAELSPRGYQFLAELFARHDRDRDGALSWTELDELFAVGPGNPWTISGFPDTTLVNEHKTGVTLQGFLAQWAMTTLLDPGLTLAYLAHLGYAEVSNYLCPAGTGKTPSSATFMNRTAVDAPLMSALKLIPGSRKRPAQLAERDVFLCYVMGGIGSGKSALLRAFLNRVFNQNYSPTTRPALAVNAVEMGGHERYLVLKEIGPFGGADQELLATPREARRADVFCLVYDASDANSFAYIATLLPLLAALVPGRPVLIIATKSDCDLVPQRFPVQPDQFCKQYSLPSPLAINLRDNRTADVFGRLLAEALLPQSVPVLMESDEDRVLRLQRRRLALWTAAGIGSAGIVALAAFAAFRLLKPSKHS